ncbi:MAG TPA: ABC-F family ATP-binding cassette domain-containing protein [Stellaceae bacterium]|jgi:ATP-binding cassette subfamily F protein 3|nr:ABC-F family ATP-binding cassette domain-containing protein [Stellaceae bacterium]
MLTLSGITYRIGGRTLIDDASAQIADGWKIGLIGRNGTGKSTLLDLIRGERTLDGGEIALPRGARIGFVAQEAPGGTMTPLEAVLAADTERHRLLAEAEHAQDGERIAEIHERLATIGAHSAEARAAGILAGLGFAHEAQQQPLSSFSGGWRMRVALAGVLFAEPELLLLDEPTNHLDLEASLWLADFLKRYRQTLILVSHDRQFLDDVADHILHLGERQLTMYSGGYEDFARARRENLARQQALAARQDDERKRLQAFIDRFRAKATKASQAQSRIKALARLEPISLSAEEPPVRLAFPEPPELSPPLVSLYQVSTGYDPEKPVLRRLDLRLDPDDRIALLGANGNGKSTFARLLAGRLAPFSGEIHRARRFACGYFAQHQIEELDPAASAYQHLARLMPKALPEALRARLARFGFDVDKVFVAAQNLSGGEKARLNFALMSVDAPPLLILDEPTNHLDIEAREALVAAINDFAGAVVIVSHDWHLLSLVADRLWLVADGTVKPFEGDLEDYRRLILAPVAAADPEANKAANKLRRETRRAAAVRRRELEPLRRQLKDAERAVSELTARKAALDQQIADPATYGGGAVASLLRDQASLGAALGEAEARWLAAAEAIEEAQAE